MLKRMYNVRDESTKRKDITSNEAKNQKLRSLNSLDLSHSNIKDSWNSAAVLTFFNETLQHHADITQYFEFSFIYDINVIEETYEMKMSRENKIQRLNEIVKTLTHVKSEKINNLRRENEELKADQEADERERETCQMMRMKLKTQHVKAETDREKEYKWKLQNEKAKI